MRLSEKAPWPHSCAATQQPVATVPVTKPYSNHAGAHDHASGMAPEAPTAKHASVSAADVSANIIERSVSLSKHSAGMAAITSLFFGYASSGSAAFASA